MTLEQYNTIISAYLDFYTDDKVDVQIRNSYLQEALGLQAEGKEVPKELQDTIALIKRESLCIITYYPKLTLTNDYGKTHDIIDVYVAVTFPNVHIKLGRTTYTQKEVEVGYRHSHVCKGNFKELSDFCTGSGTPINNIIDKIAKRDYTDFNLLIQSFIIEVERMIRIESNSGGPYISFSVIGKNSVDIPLTIKRQPSFRTNRKCHDILVDFLLYYCSLGLDDFYYDGRCWQLDATDAEFINRVSNAAKIYKKTRNADIFESVYEIGGLYYHPTETCRYHVDNNDRGYWRFKGEYVKLKVLYDESTPAKTVTILRRNHLGCIYNFLINLINGVYASKRNRDSILSRAYKIKTALVKNV